MAASASRRTTSPGRRSRTATCTSRVRRSCRRTRCGSPSWAARPGLRIRCRRARPCWWSLATGPPSRGRFFFDLGNGSVGHAIAMQVPAPFINDIFISHLHADHYADLPYMYPFRAFSGGFTPLRVYGPSGRTPELGIKSMVKHMRAMNRWHEENFNSCPVGDGMEIEVTEFDWKERNGICYDKDGVKVRHWPRSHVKDGASAYRLDWEEAGLSFVWTGDGRPDELSAEYGKGADVFVTEGTIDTPSLSALKVGSPAELWEYTIDIYHTMYYAAGYLFKQAQPRMAAICHFEWSGDQLAAESIAQVRVPLGWALHVRSGPQGHQRHEGRLATRSRPRQPAAHRHDARPAACAADADCTAATTADGGPGYWNPFARDTLTPAHAELFAGRSERDS